MWLARTSVRCNTRRPRRPVDRYCPAIPAGVSSSNDLPVPEACNFRTDGWTCFGDLRFTTRILREMGLDEPSIDTSAACFKGRGGYCDCEVIFNVDHPG
ncbi:MAG: DUF2695 domain-containing protein [Chloroflexi bacterium]|nr:MAG: DUF2695 domain-containing protein [Chloroflexota bacterium]